MRKIAIGFLGYGTRALDSLMEHPLFDVRYFFAPESRMCKDVYDAEAKYRGGVVFDIVKDNEQLARRFARINDVDCFLMNACPIILNSDVLSIMRVFNIHPGDLHYNRGHQPHCWTVFHGESVTKIVVHAVESRIDAGGVIRSVEVPVSPEDDARMVINHAEDHIALLLDGLYEYLTEDAEFEEIVEGGTYRHIMTYRDYELNFESDDKNLIQRKILSRAMNHGAFFVCGRKRIYVKRLLLYKETAKPVGGGVFIEMSEDIVRVRQTWRTMVFQRGKTEAV